MWIRCRAPGATPCSLEPAPGVAEGAGNRVRTENGGECLVHLGHIPGQERDGVQWHAGQGQLVGRCAEGASGDFAVPFDRREVEG